MLDVEAVREQVAATYIMIARMRSKDYATTEKIRDLQLAMEKVQSLFQENFP